MSEFRADLHMHSVSSDGTYTVEEIFAHAQSIGLQGISITDHDNIAAYKTAPLIAKKSTIQLLHGVEFSCQIGEESVHLLGYAFSLNAISIQELSEKHYKRRQRRNQKILEKLKQHRMPLTNEEVETSIPGSTGMIGRPHIAQAMIQKGYVETMKQAFNQYIAKGKPCYVHEAGFTPQETIAAIHEAKGVAVIAHPHLLPSKKILHQLLLMPFDGIECFYGRFPPKEHAKFLKLAHEKQWLVTGGSDFHGAVKPTIPMGCSWVNQDRFAALMEIQNRTS